LESYPKAAALATTFARPALCTNDGAARFAEVESGLEQFADGFTESKR
jgi:hypothetical protein